MKSELDVKFIRLRDSGALHRLLADSSFFEFSYLLF